MLGITGNTQNSHNTKAEWATSLRKKVEREREIREKEGERERTNLRSRGMGSIDFTPDRISD